MEWAMEWAMDWAMDWAMGEVDGVLKRFRRELLIRFNKGE